MDYVSPHWNARGVDDHDAKLRQAINVIYSSYGDKVSVEKKKKTLQKFGRSRGIGTDQKNTVQVLQDTGLNNEVFATGNTVDSLVSSDTGDFGTVFKVEGHTLDTGGFDFVVQSVTCAGQTRAALATPVARSTRLYIPPIDYPPASFPSDTGWARAATGTVYVYDSSASTITNGVPNTPAATKILVEGGLGLNQSEKLATTLSFQDYWICTEFFLTVSRDGPQNAVIDADVEYRELGGVWRPVGLELSVKEGVNGYMHDEMDPYVIIPKNSDVRMVAQSSVGDTEVSGYINGYLAVVVN